MSKLRFRVVETAFKKKAVEVVPPSERPSEYFAKYVFNKEKMFRYLSSKVYNKLIDVIDNGVTDSIICNIDVTRQSFDIMVGLFSNVIITNKRCENYGKR